MSGVRPPSGVFTGAPATDRWWWLPGTSAGVVAAVALPLLAVLTLVFAVAPLALTFGGGCAGGAPACDPDAELVVAKVVLLVVGMGALLAGALLLLAKAFGGPRTRDRRVRRWGHAVGSLACLGVVGWVYFSPLSFLR